MITRMLLRITGSTAQASSRASTVMHFLARGALRKHSLPRATKAWALTTVGTTPTEEEGEDARTVEAAEVSREDGGPIEKEGSMLEATLSNIDTPEGSGSNGEGEGGRGVNVDLDASSV
jgi:hypothetical protein